MEDYGERIMRSVVEEFARIRLERGLTLDDLATASGLHRTTVGLVMRGQRGVTVDSAARLSRALGTDLSAIVRVAEVRNNKSADPVH